MMYCPKCSKEIPDNSTFCMHCGTQTTAPVAGIAKPRDRSPLLPILVAVLIVAMGVFLYLAYSGAQKREATPQGGLPQVASGPKYIPVTESLVSGTFTVPAGRIHEIRVIVDTEKMRNVRVAGRFTAAGGTGNDVQVVFQREDDYINWKNGHQSRALYATEKITTDTFDVAVPAAGIYYLAFSNAFSGFSDKTVAAEVKLYYEQLQR